MTYHFRCIIPNDRKLCHYTIDNSDINNSSINDNNEDDDEYGEKTIVKYQNENNEIKEITLYELGVLHNFTYINRIIFLQESHYRNCYLNSLSSDCCESDLDDIDINGIDEILSKGSISKDIYIKYIDNVLNCGVFVSSLIIKKGVILGEYVGLLVPFSSHDTPSGYGMNYPCGDDSYEINAFDYGNIIRFINHSTNPNCEFRKVFYEGLVHIITVAIRDIENNEQITVNYGKSYWLAQSNDKTVSI